MLISLKFCLVSYNNINKYQFTNIDMYRIVLYAKKKKKNNKPCFKI